MVYFITISRKKPRVPDLIFTSIDSSSSSSTGNIFNRSNRKIVINGRESTFLVNGRYAFNIRERCDDPAWYFLDVENSISKSNTIDQLKNRARSNHWTKWKVLNTNSKNIPLLLMTKLFALYDDEKFTRKGGILESKFCDNILKRVGSYKEY